VRPRAGIRYEKVVPVSLGREFGGRGARDGVAENTGFAVEFTGFGIDGDPVKDTLVLCEGVSQYHVIDTGWWEGSQPAWGWETT